MANSYYERINEYLPRTRAIGEQVREDYDAIENGFNRLPEHNGDATGFTASFIVEDPTQNQSPVPLHQFLEWPQALSANGYRLTSLAPAINNSDAASLADVKSHVYGWEQSVSANQFRLGNLKDPVLDQDAVNRQTMVNYVDEHVSPDVPDGGISWSPPIAEGGETVIDPPFVFDLASVHINGAMQDQTRGAFSISNNTIRLSEPLKKGDEVQVIVGRLAPPGNSEWTLVTDHYEALNGHKLLLDSSNHNFTVILPAGPLDSDRIDFLDIGGTLSTNSVVIARNGSLIMGEDENLELKTDLVSMALLFCGLEYGWRIIE